MASRPVDLGEDAEYQQLGDSIGATAAPSRLRWFCSRASSVVTASALATALFLAVYRTQTDALTGLPLRGFAPGLGDPLDDGVLATLAGKACYKNTGGTCRYFSCDASRGNTECVAGSCDCVPGFCAVKGKCVKETPTPPPSPAPTRSEVSTPAPTVEPFVPEPSPPRCLKDTGGTCHLLNCYSSRGPTACTNGKCICEPGFCANNGKCEPEGTCLQNTGGTCHIFGCDGNRGATDCVAGACICQQNYCSLNGKCGLQVTRLTADIVVGQLPKSHLGIKNALAFSGGGSRSLSLTVGGLRALHNLGVLPKVDAISGVSGGAWATAIFMFSNMSLPELLGAATAPSELTLRKLAEQSASSRLGWAATRSMWESSVLDPTSEALREERWGAFVAASLLQPFGLDKDQYMAASAAEVERITALNPSLKGERFLLPAEGRPRLYIMGGTILSPYGYSADGRDAMDIQMSPDFTGSPVARNTRYIKYGTPPVDRTVGGGFMETFAMGAEPGTRNGLLETDMQSPGSAFSLKKALSISSAAFASKFNGQMGESLNPRLHYWPILPAEQQEECHTSLDYEFGDGGNMENAGVLPLLQRGASNIIWFINTDTGVSKVPDFCSEQTPHSTVADFAGKVTNQLTDKFGFGTDDASAGFLAHNQVFAQEELAPLLCNFQMLRAVGKPMVVKLAQKVLPNAEWGINGGNTVNMTYVYNEYSENFVSSLPKETRDEIKSGSMFSKYPFFATVHQQSGEFTAYTMEQVNLLAAQSEYFIMQNEDLVRDMFQSRS